jgi:hypothetical protein
LLTAVTHDIGFDSMMAPPFLPASLLKRLCISKENRELLEIRWMFSPLMVAALVCGLVAIALFSMCLNQSQGARLYVPNVEVENRKAAIVARGFLFKKVIVPVLFSGGCGKQSTEVPFICRLLVSRC